MLGRWLPWWNFKSFGGTKMPDAPHDKCAVDSPEQLSMQLWSHKRDSLSSVKTKQSFNKIRFRKELGRADARQWYQKRNQLFKLVFIARSLFLWKFQWNWNFNNQFRFHDSVVTFCCCCCLNLSNQDWLDWHVMKHEGLFLKHACQVLKVLTMLEQKLIS